MERFGAREWNGGGVDYSSVLWEVKEDEVGEGGIKGGEIKVVKKERNKYRT